MIEINESVVFVHGACNGAIYDFNNGDIFSINNESCCAIDKMIKKEPLSDEEADYIKILKKKHLLDERVVKPYQPTKEPYYFDLCWLEITQACNCRCLHCYEGNVHLKSTDSLSLNEWKKVIDEVALLNIHKMVIIGGEPCCHSNICEICEYAAKTIKSVTLFTNGTLISDDLKKIILENDINVKFSLYGHNAITHDRITNTPGSFEKLIDNIYFFKKHGIKVNIAVVIMKENERYYNDIINFLRRIKCDYRIDVIREVFGGVQSVHVPESLSIISSVKRTKPDFMPISKRKFDLAYYYNTCWFGKFVVTENGNILPCVFERNTVFGNIRDDELIHILNKESAIYCREYCFEKIDKCKNCEYRFACKDCRPLAKAVRSIYDKNPRCDYDPYRGEWK